jgi:hypothetical protein
VLFSRPEVADTINNTFEPTWETVRPVPIVQIDFGDGNKLTRTLQGNIATYACTADGYVLDVLPGIYDPAGYRKGLEELAALAKAMGRQPANKRANACANYHRLCLEASNTRRAAVQPVASGFQSSGGTGGLQAGMGGFQGGGMGGARSGNGGGALGALGGGQSGFASGGLGKFGVEGGLKSVVWSPRPLGFAGASQRLPNAPAVEQVPPLEAAEDLANWKALREDTRINETVRRRQIHQMLAGKGLVRPNEIVKPLYKEVLHADLDDPYLGLGQVLFANYPFAKEDKKLR